MITTAPVGNQLPTPASGAVAPERAAWEGPPMQQIPAPTFQDLVAQLVRSDELLEDPNFDPAQLIGQIRDKVDAIKSVIDRMENVEAYLRGCAKPLLEKARAIGANQGRLKKYVAETMAMQHIEKIPGNMFSARLRTSPPAMEMTRPASPQDFVEHPNYVQMIREYRWDAAKIKADLLSGDLKEGVLPAQITRGNWVEFPVLVPEQLEKKKKGKTNG
jgi:hypothetical protein